MSKVFRVGTIGVGYTCNVHAPGWKESPHAELAALADLNEEALNRVADRLEVKKRYTTARELIEDPEIDVVDICTPNMTHAPLAVAAFKAGKHVLCEKPLAPTPAEIRRMIKARDAAGKLLMTAQHMRYLGTARAMKAEIERGVLGRIYHARAWILRRCGVPLGPGFIRRELSGGGACIDIGVHILDLTLWLMGFPRPVTVSGFSRNELSKRPNAFSWGRQPIPESMDVEDFAGGFVRFEGGQTLMIEISWLLHHDTPGEVQRVWLYGTEGGAEWPANKLIADDLPTRQLIDRQLILHDGGAPHALECIDFARALAQGLPSPVPAEESLYVQAILDGIYRSAEQGREVKVNL
ncbi:MAG TPA: Gfo/Idh/MocA family oxidoreductase [Candidatus Sumerlaeota bacterium]|nr:MAG: putative oxidoreductase YcjS [candidate division BRC1 bacterium ADurb.BinA292]HOE96234.1 Gfo/Idh/MocA family oxidoreductase [Candidatus Sumerlaeota bacterium]HPK01154.1 Gfo/Idh/MocA family oxidoreductase [Candidatus Sumerlaeota bacterium]